MTTEQLAKLMTDVLLETLPDIDDITPLDIAICMGNVAAVVQEAQKPQRKAIPQADGMIEIPDTKCDFCKNPCGNPWCGAK